MNRCHNNVTPRREFIKNTGRVAAGLALAGVSIPQVHAGEDKLTVDSPAPVQADAQGRYPAPVPGKWVEI